jgi:hypothetical protein
MSPEMRVKALREGPSDGWAAFSENEDRIVAYGATYEEAVENAGKSGVTEPVLVKIPKDWKPAVL